MISDGCGRSGNSTDGNWIGVARARMGNEQFRRHGNAQIGQREQAGEANKADENEQT